MHTFSTALKKIVDADLSLSNAGIMVISLRSTEDLTSLCPLSSGARNVHSLLARRVEKMNSKESKCPLFKILENGENELNGIKMSSLYELERLEKRNSTGEKCLLLTNLERVEKRNSTGETFPLFTDLERVEKMNSTGSKCPLFTNLKEWRK
jgi:hypothetical protein